MDRSIILVSDALLLLICLQVKEFLGKDSLPAVDVFNIYSHDQRMARVYYTYIDEEFRLISRNQIRGQREREILKFN